MTKFIIVVGGVISGVGKGVSTAALGKVFKEHGFKTTLIKIDPYINYDAGTLRPTEHGEVWVTDDGGEIDQDLGTYERFLNVDILKKNNITTGQVYKSVIDRERSGGYLGQTVQYIPHIPDEIIERIKKASEGYEIAIIEIGGTVGDYENIPFLFAVKALERELGTDNVAYVLVTFLPVPGHIHEMKTKPTQQAIRLLRQEGIVPDMIICRAQYPIDDVRKKKIEKYAYIDSEYVVSAPDVKTIYQVPLDLEAEKIGQKLLSRLKLESKKKPDWSTWHQLVDAIIEPQKRINIAIVGKYLDIGDYSLSDSYLSIGEALIHAGAQHGVGIDVTWIDSKEFEKNPQKVEELKQYNGIIIPGGFGASGVEGKIKAIEYARTHKIPYLGICYGMQLAVIEFARHVAGMQDANTTEVNQETVYPVITILPVQQELIDAGKIGGTMRLGAYQAQVKPGTNVYALYKDAGRMKNDMVTERHRHRYEVNPELVPQLEDKGLVFSGMHKRVDGTTLMEFIELKDHPFFVATQAHPEFKSRLGNPSPLFYGFVGACINKK